MLHFDVNSFDKDMRIEEISWAGIPYKRPRIAGKNARLDTHGWGGDVPIAKIRAGNTEGFGWCTLSLSQAELITGVPVRALFTEDGMLRKEYRGIEFPILDWLGQYFHKPVYQLVAKHPEKVTGGFKAICYDTTIYFDELHIKDDRKAIDFLLDEVREGLERGHKHFKIKIGRCGMWMKVPEGLQRDINVVNEIRNLVGPDSKLMVDANNGYNLSITKEFLLATKDVKLHWLEEAFHEDNMLYINLKSWLKDQGIATLIADGEGEASPSLMNWVRKGLIDIVQYDLRGYGFFSLMELCKEIETAGAFCAPHNYGGFYGNFAQGHFASCTDNFAFAEIDIADAEGIDTSAYKIKDGFLKVPALDGFGLVLDKTVFEKYRGQKGYKTELTR